MSATNPARYSGKPLLRLLECYTLHAIGSLADKDEKALIAMTPKFQEVYKVQGTWREIIEKVMELPSSMPTAIREMWEKNQRIAERSHATLTPQAFAEMFVDANLTSTGERGARAKGHDCHVKRR